MNSSGVASVTFQLVASCFNYATTCPSPLRLGIRDRRPLKWNVDKTLCIRDARASHLHSRSESVFPSNKPAGPLICTAVMCTRTDIPRFGTSVSTSAPNSELGRSVWGVCSGYVGANYLRTRGRTPSRRLLHTARQRKLQRSDTGVTVRGGPHRFICPGTSLGL
jgi:hypothetical protein